MPKVKGTFNLAAPLLTLVVLLLAAAVLQTINIVNISNVSQVSEINNSIPRTIKATVERVVDGDTFVASLPGGAV